MSSYAVIDIETTGISTAYHHRIIEIAVVLVDDEGNLVYEWETLVNPQREVSATEIHGLTATDVYRAPTFDQIAYELRSLLSGRVPVAHNLSFDATFLDYEYERLGYSVPIDLTCGLCTMRLASLYLPVGPRTLEACCDRIGFQMKSAHAALEDARATASLLSHYIQSQNDFPVAWIEIISRAQNVIWPEIPKGKTERIARTTASAASHTHFLGRLVTRAPRSEVHPEANSYLALIDRVLLDSQLSLHEEDELVSVAGMLGLSREEAKELHRRYLFSLGRLAMEDGVITTEERADLKSVALMLGLTVEDVEDSLDTTKHTVDEECIIGGFALKLGDAVVFTGEAPGINREDLEYQARSLGLRVTGSVSRKTCLVVAADPDTLSGKARKARNFGIPIVDYGTYLKMLDYVERE